MALLYPIPFERSGQSTTRPWASWCCSTPCSASAGTSSAAGRASSTSGPASSSRSGPTPRRSCDSPRLNAWLGLLPARSSSRPALCAALTYPVTRLRGHYFAIATVAMWMIAQPIGATWEFINGSRASSFRWRRAAASCTACSRWSSRARQGARLLLPAALALRGSRSLGARAVERSKLGFYFRAVRDDQDGAEGIGIDSRLYKVIARCLMAAIFAAGGVLYGFWALAVFPDQVLEVNWNILPMMAAVVGGIGRLWGPVLGAIILIPISQLMTATLGAGPLAGRGIDLIIYGAVIMLIAGWRPNGLLSLPWARWAAALCRPAPAEPGGLTACRRCCASRMHQALRRARRQPRRLARHRAAGDRRPDRAQRRRQDHALQLHQRRAPPRRGPHRARRRRHLPRAPRARVPPRHRADLAGRADLRPHDRAGERDLRRAPAHEPDGPGAGARARAAGLHRPRRQGGRARGEPHPRRQEAARDHAGSGHPAPPAAARRGHVRAHPDRDGGRRGAGAPHPRRARAWPSAWWST